MLKKVVKNIFLISLIFLFLISSPVYANDWSVMLNGPQTQLTFTDPESTELGYILIPFVLLVSGAWEEYWSGSTSYAELTRLYHSATIYNPNNSLLPIENLWPSILYDDGTTSKWWTIVYPYTWTLHSSTDMWTEGYNNPGTWYYLGRLRTTGEVYVYIPDSMEINRYVYYYFR